MVSVMANRDNDLPSAHDVRFAEKLVHSLSLVHRAFGQFGDRLVVEHNLTQESCVVWDLAKLTSPKIRGFCVATRFQPAETITFMKQLVTQYPEIRIYESSEQTPDELPDIDPFLCCEILRNRPRRQAFREMNISCLMTCFHHDRGSVLLDFCEFQEITPDVSEFHPIMTWNDLDIARYIESRQIPCSSLNEQGSRKIGCWACLRC